MDEKREEIEGSSTGTCSGDTLNNLLASPLMIRPITSSKLILDFEKINPFQKFQIGEPIQASAKK